MRLLSLILASSLIATASVAHADDDTPPPPHDSAMRSPALLGTGVTFASVGGLAIPVGAFLLLIPKSQPECFTGPCPSVDYTARDWAGAGLLAGGLALVGASIPMIVLGARRVPVSVSSGPLGSAGLTLQARF